MATVLENIETLRAEVLNTPGSESRDNVEKLREITSTIGGGTGGATVFGLVIEQNNGFGVLTNTIAAVTFEDP